MHTETWVHVTAKQIEHVLESLGRSLQQPRYIPKPCRDSYNVCMKTTDAFKNLIAISNSYSGVKHIHIMSILKV